MQRREQILYSWVLPRFFFRKWTSIRCRLQRLFWCLSLAYTASMRSSCMPKLRNWNSSTRLNDRSVPCPLCRGRNLANQVAFDRNLQTRADNFRRTRGLVLRPKPRPANVTAYWKRERRFSAARIHELSWNLYITKVDFSFDWLTDHLRLYDLIWFAIKPFMY